MAFGYSYSQNLHERFKFLEDVKRPIRRRRKKQKAKSPELKIVPAPKNPSPIAQRHSSTIQIRLRKRPIANGQ